MQSVPLLLRLSVGISPLYSKRSFISHLQDAIPVRKELDLPSVSVSSLPRAFRYVMPRSNNVGLTISVRHTELILSATIDDGVDQVSCNDGQSLSRRSGLLHGLKR